MNPGNVTRSTNVSAFMKDPAPLVNPRPRGLKTHVYHEM